MILALILMSFPLMGIDKGRYEAADGTYFVFESNGNNGVGYLGYKTAKGETRTSFYFTIDMDGLLIQLLKVESIENEQVVWTETVTGYRNYSLGEGSNRGIKYVRLNSKIYWHQTL